MENLNLTEDIYRQIWAQSGSVLCQNSYHDLTQLTQQLIQIYESQARLETDPFNSARKRRIHLPVKQIQHELNGQTIVVTGGLGCVGTILVNELLKFRVKSIIILDCRQAIAPHPSAKVSCVKCDIRDAERVGEIFNQHKPDIVFHTAAQRDPGLAESNVLETVGTNVLGTLNIANACEACPSVRQMVASSTGKASRYYTREVYAASKKWGEFLIEMYARRGNLKYSLIRCTHILDNSLMDLEFAEASIQREYLAVHSPGKYVTAQNALEAAHLLLNALVYSKMGQCQFLLVRHLEWPVESLEVALHHVKQSQRNIPVIFVGNPPGYAEKFFRGQVDWSEPAELNLLINVYENKGRSLNEAGDITIARPCTTNFDVLIRELDLLRAADSEAQARNQLTAGLRSIVSESLKTVEKEQTANILRWGLDPKLWVPEQIQISDYEAVVSLLLESVLGTEYYQPIIDLVTYDRKKTA